MDKNVSSLERGTGKGSSNLHREIRRVGSQHACASMHLAETRSAQSLRRRKVDGEGRLCRQLAGILR